MSNNSDQNNVFANLKSELSDFQKELHTPEDLNGPNDPLKNVKLTQSEFYVQYRKSEYYYQYPEIMSLTQTQRGGKTVHIYRVNNSPHGLLYADIMQDFPFIECQPGYKARWTHNAGSNIIDNGSFNFNGKSIQSIDYRYNDHMGQTMLKPSTRDNYNRNLGNLTDEFQEKIARFTTSYRIPTFNSKTPENYFPLFYCGLSDTIDYSLYIRSKISDLLEIRDADNRIVKFSSISIKTIGGFEDIREDIKLQNPQMWGQYIIFSEAECKAASGLCMAGNNIINRNIYYYEDVIIKSDSNPSNLGNLHVIELKDIKEPCIRIGWAAQNQKALANKFYSNYSTNSEYILNGEGVSPISTISLYKGTSPLFVDLPAFRTERIYPEIHYPCVPTEPGYGSWSFGYWAGKTSIASPGVVFSTGSISFQLDDSDLIYDCKENACNDKFKVHVFLTVLKRLRFVSFPDSDENRAHIGAVIRIES